MTSTTDAPARLGASPTAGPARRAPRGRRAQWSGLAFVLPGFALYALVMLYPAVQTLLMSLRDWNIVPGAESPWVGLDNYVRAFQDPDVVDAAVNALVYTVVTVPLQIIIGLGIAVLLDAALPGRTLFRVLFYLPVITSWVVVSLLFQFIFSSGDQGLANSLLMNLGLTDTPVSFFLGRWSSYVAICALGVWKGLGWAMLIFLAALTGVPRELHEAAALDGANGWQRFRNVSLPSIRSALAVVIILLVIGGFNVFISVLLMTGGANGTQVPLTMMYEEAFSHLEFGYGSAISFSLTMLVLALSALQYWWTKRKADL